MDTFHFEPQSVHSRQVRRLFGDHEPRRFDEMNLSEPEVFMLRGRRLQAHVIGDALRHALAKLRSLLNRLDWTASRPGPG